MERIYFEGREFDRIIPGKDFLKVGEYENCTFTNCELSNSDLSNINFTDCAFNDCNLSVTKIANTTFNGVSFKNCKLLGLQFRDCNAFLMSVYFEHCILNLSSFFKLKLKKIKFQDSTLDEVDFTETDLTGSLFGNCDLSRAIFDNTVLEKADFRTSFNYSIDPERNRIKKAKFSISGIAGLLDKYDIEIEE
jgi:fluoroquinolone resistance protein